MRLDEIAAEYGDDVNIEWRSFLLRPQPEERTMEAFTAYTSSWARPASLEPRATFNQWSGQADPPSHSMPSAVAGKVAATFGPELYDAFHHRAMDAYFTRNLTISDRSVLLDIAEEAGIDRAEFEQRWDERNTELTNEVIDDHNDALDAGVSGVPAIVVDDTHLVVGAVETEYYREVIATVRAEG